VDPDKDIEVKVELSFDTKPASFFFGRYVDYYFKMKTEAKNNGDYIKTQMFKVYLNSTYGKFSSKVLRATRDLQSAKSPQLFGNIREYTTKNSYYIPLGATITAMARMRLINAAGMQGHKVAYTDTDSLKAAVPSKDFNRTFPDLKMGSNLGQFE
jgi:DNA polymerase elongation subunit (family B)